MEWKEELASIRRISNSSEIVQYLLNDLQGEPFTVSEEEITLEYSVNHGKSIISLEFAPRTVTKHQMSILTFRLYQLFKIRFEENSVTVPNLAFDEDFKTSKYEVVCHENELKFTIYTPDLDTSEDKV